MSLRNRLDVSGKGELAHLLPQILSGLQTCGTCAVAVDASNTIQLQLPPPHAAGHRSVPPLSAVGTGMVPFLITAVPGVATLRRWDLTLQRLIRFIDGTCDACFQSLA